MNATRAVRFLLLSVSASLILPISLRAEPFQLEEATLAGIQEAFESGELTSEMLVSEYLSRIAAYDGHGPRLNSILTLNPAALDAARALDQERAESGPRGPLHGVPVLIKDNLDTFDMPTTAGSLVFEGSVPPDDAFIVQRLRDAGAIILGKTNLHEFALGITTTSGLGGQTLNPYDTTRTPGGSSGGTAAAISANLAVVGLGTDTAASIRYPAAMTNLVGIRPTLGLTSRDGLIPLALSKDVAGPIARTVTDAALLLDVIAGPDPADPSTADSTQHIPPSYTDSLNSNGLAGARIGIFRQLVDRDAADPNVLALFDAAVDQMQALGAEVVDLPEIMGLPDGDPLATTYPSLEYDMNRYLESLGDQAPHPDTRAIFQSGQLAPYVQIFEAFLRGDIPPEEDDLFSDVLLFKGAIQSAVLGVMDAAEVDAVVYPTSLTIAPEVGNPVYGLEMEDVGLNTDLSPVLGWPSITVPGGFTFDGLPMGIEFMGRAWSEGRLLELAFAYEQATLHRQSPTLVPEPTALGLAGLGCGCLAVWMFLRKRPSVIRRTISCQRSTAVASMLLANIVSASAYGQGQIINETLQHDGLTRTYSLYIPEAYTGDTPWPLVVNMHGRYLTAADQIAFSGMNAVADTEEFLVVYPQGVGTPTGWNNLEEPEGADDVGFTGAMLDELEAIYSIDSSRVYATGLSNGGGMSNLLGSRLSDRIAAVASVAGPFIVTTPRPLPALHMHGTADAIAPYDGGPIGIPGLNIIFPAVDDVIDAWRENNHSTGDPIVEHFPDVDPNDSSTVQLFKYEDGAHYLTSSGDEQTAEVLLYRIEGGGHNWPGGPPFDPPFSPVNRDINASQEIWNFFSRHTLPASAIPEPSCLMLGMILFAVLLLARSWRA
jgi:amidase